MSGDSARGARDPLLANVAHELRTPLNGIKSWTHVLQNAVGEPDPMVARAIDGILIGIEQQVRLIDNLLDATRALWGTLEVTRRPMDLVAVLADAIEAMRALAAEKSLHLVMDYGDSELEVNGDPDRVRQMVSQLLANAIRFTPAAGTVRISASIRDGMACIEVRDEGAAITPDFIPHVFEAFPQNHPAPGNRRHDGLGLAMVRRLAEMHDGRATCESTGNERGATFCVFLPLRT